MTMFTDPAAVARYAEGPMRQVPGFLDLQRMALVLLSESAPRDARILVLGAGGGLELLVFATARPDWRFTGVDPSAPMLARAAEVTADHAARIALVQGTIDAAPPDPFDGATCLLTFHFIPRDQRLPTLRALRDRLKPGAPLVLAHMSCPGGAERDRWLDRYAAFSAGSGIPAARMAEAVERIRRELTVLDPAEEEALLRAAGFTDIQLFYTGFAFRGWVAVAG